MYKVGGSNRLELETRILCSALRQSRADSDEVSIATVWRQLSHLFPDLIEQNSEDGEPIDYYKVLQVEYDQGTLIRSAYFISVKQFLRNNPDPSSVPDEYFRLLDAGLVLRRERLRLSHDLISTRTANKVRDYQEDTIDFYNPLLIELLRVCDIISDLEVLALRNQLAMHPDIPLFQLILQAEYVSEPELIKLECVEHAIRSGQLTLAQFLSNPDLHTCASAANSFRPPNDPPDSTSPVPRLPYPTNGSGDVRLQLPD